ncbi:MAG: hypothetical protein HKO64_11035 [Xanthomonadales bacterium]|nr:hypothetical protein [Gammaproteobacteria bacterium]NNL96145.1 hypothetical protein [Xanthomonadales bacterium]
MNALNVARPAMCLWLWWAVANPLAAQEVTTLVPNINASGGVSVGPDGNIYVADFGQFLSNQTNIGTTVYKVTPQGQVSVFATGFFGASGNDFDAQGNLIQANIGASRLDKVTPDGVRTALVVTGLSNPVGVAINAGGEIFAANCGANSISRVQGSAAVNFVVGPPLSCPNGLTVDPDGNLYTANFNNGNIIRITPAGQMSVLANTPGSTFRPGGGNGHITYGNGRLYLASNATSQIYELTLDGTLTVIAGNGTRGHADGPALQSSFSFPNGIALSADGRFLYLNESLSTAGTVLNGNTFPLNPGAVRRIDLGSQFTINAGINDAWISADAPFQGLFFTVFPDLGLFFLSWFTFDSVPPDSGEMAVFGAPGQRWVTASGPFEGNTATLSVELTSGGIFNASDPLAMQSAGYGTISISFTDCDEALLSYDFPAVGLSGQMTVTRAVPTNNALCQSLAGG